MLSQATLEKMTAMKLYGMAQGFEEQLGKGPYQELSFEERVGFMVDREWTSREQRRLARRLKAAKLRYPASIENVDFKTPRGVDRQQLLSLANCHWIREHQNVVLTGPTGIGKSYLACALVEKACRSGFSAYYVRCPRLAHELAVARGDGSYVRWLVRLGKVDLLAIDDWLILPLKESERRDLMEVIEERSERRSILIASQLPVKDWHAAIGDPNLADGICDRLLHQAHRLSLKGPSMRRPEPSANSSRPTRGGESGDGDDGDSFPAARLG